jgi:transposase
MHLSFSHRESHSERLVSAGDDSCLPDTIDELETALTQDFEQHPDAKIILSMPGLGMVLGARVLASSGMTRIATPTASLVGTTRHVTHY